MSATAAVLVLCLLSASGCVTQPPPAAENGTQSSLQTARAGQEGTTGLLRAGQPAVLTNGSCSFTATVERFDVSTGGKGGHTVDIYIRAANTGTSPLLLNWYSTLADTSGRLNGGPGVSHDGSGAVTRMLDPGYSETARDYVAVASNTEYTALTKGGVLDVVFYCTPADGGKVLVLRQAWALLPGTIR